MNQSNVLQQAEMARRAVIEALEHRLYGQGVPEVQLVDLARKMPGFARAWLAHAIGSEATAAELALALALVAERSPDDLPQLASFWDGIAVAAEGPAPDLQHRLASHDLVLADKWVELWRRMGTPVQPDQAAVDRPVQLAALPLEPGRLGLIRSRVAPRLQPAEVYGQQRSERQAQVRDSDQAIMPAPTADYLLASLERMMGAATGQGLAAAEPLVVLRYRPGQQYRWHRDYIQPTTPEVVEEIRRFGQRVYTVIAYLSSGFDGGETEFRDWDLSLRPDIAQCIGFASVRADGSLDPESIHRGAPVRRGEKWIGTLWYRSRPLWNRCGLLVPQPGTGLG